MVIIRVCVTVKEGSVQDLQAVLAADIPETRKFDGCERFDVYQDIQEARDFILYEEWDSQANFDAYRESDYFKEIGGKIFPLLDGTPDSAYYQAELID